MQWSICTVTGTIAFLQSPKLFASNESDFSASLVLVAYALLTCSTKRAVCACWILRWRCLGVTAFEH